MNYFLTAIGTDSGKTLVSSILVQALGADYWKPVQAGFPADTEQVRRLTDSRDSRFYGERYVLNTPASPHAAAKIDGVKISLKDFHPPVSNRDLIIEGAGGLMVPLNDEEVIIDMVPLVNAEVILVCNLYLGSINHSLLSIELLKQRGYPVKGIVFNGPANEESERIILQKSGWPCLFRVAQHEAVTPALVEQYAEEVRNSWS